MAPQAWLVPTDVRAHVGGAALPEDPADPVLARYVDAAAAYVEARKPGLDFSSPATVPADVWMGAALMVARLYARRGTQLGLASYGEFAAQVARADPDVARLLGIGEHTLPGVG